MVRPKDELLEVIKSILPDSTTDDALSLIEDVSDTLDNTTNTDNEDWKKRYEENDKMWRERYRDRFFSPTNDNLPKEDEVDEVDEEEPAKRNYEDLFKTE